MRMGLIILLLTSGSCFANAWSNWAVPVQIDVERGNGFMIYGAFGNPNSCTNADRLYVHVSHPQYTKIYALVMTAFTAGK